MVLHPVFPADELKKAVAQRQERLKTDKDNVQGAIRNYYLATLYAGHPYARQLLATEASLASITRDDVVSVPPAGVHAGERGDRGGGRFQVGGDGSDVEADVRGMEGCGTG